MARAERGYAMTTRYAARTEVSADKSKSEIERILRRYGATKFVYGWDDETALALVSFRMTGRDIRMIVPMPDPNDPAFRYSTSGRARTSQDAIIAAWEQATRQRWRAVVLIIKAKLEAVEAGISTLDREFLADTLLPNGQTAGEWLQPQITAAYATGRMPATLPGLPAPNGVHLLADGVIVED